MNCEDKKIYYVPGFGWLSLYEMWPDDNVSDFLKSQR